MEITSSTSSRVGTNPVVLVNRSGSHLSRSSQHNAETAINESHRSEHDQTLLADVALEN